MQTDRELLDAYTESRSEVAFRTLVERHLDLVHSVARRVTLNDELARDVSQAVFLQLATRPEKVPQGVKMLAWFHRTTRHKAIDFVRSENRRKRREQIASQRREIEMKPEEELDWNELEPVLDSALEKLSEQDRTLILARFYKSRSHARTARDLGISEDAARMRTKRALEKLRAVLSKRGVLTPAALLGSTVAANAVQPAPAALGVSICSTSMAVVSATVTTAGGTTIFGIGKIYAAALAALVIGIPVIALQLKQNSDLKRDVTQLELRLHQSLRSAGAKPGAPDVHGGKAAKHSDLSLHEILAINDPIARVRELLGYVERVDRERIPEVIDRLRESTPEWDPDGKVAIQLLLKRWAKSDAIAAMKYVDALDIGKAGEEAACVLSVMAAEDPRWAVEWLDDPENNLGKMDWLRDSFAGTIAKEWVRRDSEEAFAWARSVGGVGRSGALVGVLGTIAATDPVGAAQLASGLPADSARTEVVRQIAQAWAGRSPQEAIDWANSLSEGDRKEGVGAVLGTWAERSPEAAAAYVDALPEEQRGEDYAPRVAITWSQHSPEAAANWLIAQQEEGDESWAMGKVMWNWTTADPPAASKWLLGLPPGASRDDAIGGLATAAFAEDPQAAVTWASSIGDRYQRTAALHRTLYRWLASDPATARGWLTSSDILPEHEVQDFLTDTSEKE